MENKKYYWMSDEEIEEIEDAKLMLKIYRKYGIDNPNGKKNFGKIKPFASSIFNYLRKSGAYDGDFDRLCESEEFRAKSKREQKEIKTDIIECLFRFGMKYDEYVRNNCSENKSDEYRKGFVSGAVMSGYTDILNDYFNENEPRDHLDNKAKTYAILGEEYYRRDVALLEKKEDIPSCVELLKKHGGAIVKAVCGGLGQDIFFVYSDSCANPEQYFADKLSHGKYIVEELIKQSGILEKIYPDDCVNTLRVISFTSKKSRETKFALVQLRTAMHGSAIAGEKSNVGNWLGLNIDAETGNGIGELFDTSLNKYASHPDTGIAARDICLPEWEKLKKLVSDGAKKLADYNYRLIGWDFAYGRHGWCVIEANANPGVPLPVKPEFDELRDWAEEN